MKQNERILIGVLVLILAIVLIVVMVNKNEEEGNAVSPNKVNVEDQNMVDENVKTLKNGTRVNTSEELVKEKKVDELEITNIELKATGGITTLLADVKNPTNKDKESIKVKVEILDKTGKTIVTLRGKIDPVKAGKTVKLNIAATADVANAYDFKITKE